jgi:hypothetical protein
VRPDENAAVMEIHEKRGFPQLLGKVPGKSVRTFPHLSQAAPVDLLISVSHSSWGFPA